MIANLENELNNIEKRIHVLLVDINEEDTMRDGRPMRRKQRELEKELHSTVNAKKIIVGKLEKYKECKVILKDKISTIIANDLTQFTNDEIQNFMRENDNNVEKVIEMMIDDYEKDGELELLKEPTFAWIGEYLYEFVPSLKHE